MKRKYLLLLIPFLLTGCKRGNISSSFPSSSSLSEKSKKALHFFAINDFHGAVVESDSEPGIFRLSSYIKALENETNGNLIKINAGDYWQGSADSNLNRGNFLTEAMNLLSFDSFTLGNHEFDWFDTAITTNKELANYPFLGANIISKATNTLATNIVSYDDSFKASTMITRNDVNIGIIGTIGSTLESSILAAAVESYSFEPVTQYIKDEAANLRSLGANMIVLSTHDSLTSSLGEYQEIINDKVVDMIFSGHFHTQDDRVVNGIPILQTNGYGKQVMEVSGYYNFETANFELDSSGLVSGDVIKTYAEDSEMLELFAPYDAASAVIKNEVLGSFSSFMSKGELAQLATKVLYLYGSEKYKDHKVITLHNSGGVRKDIEAGTVTYGDIYEAFPFDNEIRVIENISGSSVKSLMRSYVSYSDGSTIDTNETYTVVTIDYISTANNYMKNLPQVLTGEYVRDLLADYIRDQKSINL